MSKKNMQAAYDQSCSRLYAQKVASFLEPHEETHELQGNICMYYKEVEGVEPLMCAIGHLIKPEILRERRYIENQMVTAPAVYKALVDSGWEVDEKMEEMLSLLQSAHDDYFPRTLNSVDYNTSLRQWLDDVAVVAGIFELKPWRPKNG